MPPLSTSSPSSSYSCSVSKFVVVWIVKKTYAKMVMDSNYITLICCKLYYGFEENCKKLYVFHVLLKLWVWGKLSFFFFTFCNSSKPFINLKKKIEEFLICYWRQMTKNKAIVAVASGRVIAFTTTARGKQRCWIPINSSTKPI
jgi:hypothetical protein